MATKEQSEVVAAPANAPPAKNKKEINILLLGETGIGKSTFINALLNYLQHQDFGAAQNSDLNAIIPSTFPIYDKDGNCHDITVGQASDKNEDHETGTSATQKVRSYTFLIKNGTVQVRLIDTPGMGDTRGIEQDNVNCENILNYIGRLHHLHAICYLCRPHQTRATVYFEYCVAQIMSRLHADACKNFVFVFTSSRGSNYTPGDTFAILKNMADKIQKQPAHAKLRLDDNKFCVDNEAIRYLAAVKQGIEFRKEDKNNYLKSWTQSATECWRMIDYILKLHPHYVKNTSAINEARRVISQLSQPMADIAQLIQDNIALLKKHKSALYINYKKIDDLKKKLYVPSIELTITALPKPTTVCTALKCVEVYKVGDKNAHHYKTRCHDPCFLHNVERETIGHPELTKCWAMEDGNKCRKCGCTYHQHMHVYYLTKKIVTQERDEKVLSSITNDEAAIEYKNKLIKQTTSRQKMNKEELYFIIQSTAKFAHFLQRNAISAFTDSYEDYINHLIIKEQSLGTEADNKKLNSLTIMLNEYKAQKLVFDQAVIEKEGTPIPVITPQDINKTMQDLFDLKLNGKKVKELYNSKKNALKKEWEFTEYKHKDTFGEPPQPKPKPKKVKKPAKKAEKATASEIKVGRIVEANSTRAETPPPSYENAQKKKNDSNKRGNGSRKDASRNRDEDDRFVRDNRYVRRESPEDYYQSRDYPHRSREFKDDPRDYHRSPSRERPAEPRDYRYTSGEYRAPSKLDPYPPSRDYPRPPKEYPPTPRDYPYASRDYPATPRDYPYPSREYSAVPRDYPYSSREYSEPPSRGRPLTPRDYHYPSREYPAPSTDYSRPTREYPEGSREYPYASREYPANSRDYPDPSRDYSRRPREYPDEPRDYRDSREFYARSQESRRD